MLFFNVDTNSCHLGSAKRCLLNMQFPFPAEPGNGEDIDCCSTRQLQSTAATVHKWQEEHPFWQKKAVLGCKIVHRLPFFEFFLRRKICHSASELSAFGSCPWFRAETADSRQGEQRLFQLFRQLPKLGTSTFGKSQMELGGDARKIWKNCTLQYCSHTLSWLCRERGKNDKETRALISAEVALQCCDTFSGTGGSVSNNNDATILLLAALLSWSNKNVCNIELTQSASVLCSRDEAVHGGGGRDSKMRCQACCNTFTSREQRHLTTFIPTKIAPNSSSGTGTQLRNLTRQSVHTSKNSVRVKAHTSFLSECFCVNLSFIAPVHALQEQPPKLLWISITECPIDCVIEIAHSLSSNDRVADKNSPIALRIRNGVSLLTHRSKMTLVNSQNAFHTTQPPSLLTTKNACFSEDSMTHKQACKAK